MKTLDIRFLPIELENNQLTIKEPYLNTVLEYLNRHNIEFKYIEEKINLQTSKIKEDDLNNLIKIIKDKRAKILQNKIVKNYL